MLRLSVQATYRRLEVLPAKEGRGVESAYLGADIGSERIRGRTDHCGARGMTVSDARRLKELESGNAMPKQLLAESELKTLTQTDEEANS